MYQNVRLEKGLYHLTGKTFVQALESLDPSEQYQGTPLEKLDAYERQLKRFDIRISGDHCDKVEKFFNSTESAVLFPEFVRRALRKGVQMSVLSQLCAVETHAESSQYLGCSMADNESYNTSVNAGDPMHTSTITEDSTAITLRKYGRTVKATYEAIRRQRLDVFAVFLMSVGKQLGNALVTNALNTLSTNAAGSFTAPTLTYETLTTLCGKFTTYDMNLLLVSPANFAKILAFEEMQEVVPLENGTVRLPFGATMCKVSNMLDTVMLGLDSRFALESIFGTDLVMETDRMIDNQIEQMTISTQCGFHALTKNAIYKASITG